MTRNARPDVTQTPQVVQDYVHELEMALHALRSRQEAPRPIQKPAEWGAMSIPQPVLDYVREMQDQLGMLSKRLGQWRRFREAGRGGVKKSVPRTPGRTPEQEVLKRAGELRRKSALPLSLSEAIERVLAEDLSLYESWRRHVPDALTRDVVS